MQNDLFWSHIKYLLGALLTSSVLLLGCSAPSSKGVVPPSAPPPVGPVPQPKSFVAYAAGPNGLFRISSTDPTPKPLAVAGIEATKVAKSGNTIAAASPIGLWYSSDSGRSWTLWNSSTGLISNVVNDITIDPAGNFFIATPAGLEIVNAALTKAWYLSQADGLPATNVRALAVGVDGVIYIATERGLAISTDSGATVHALSAATDQPTPTGSKGVPVYNTAKFNLSAIAVDGTLGQSTSRIVIGANSGLYLSTDSGSSFQKLQQPCTSAPSALSISPSDSKLWAAVRGTSEGDSCLGVFSNYDNSATRSLSFIDTSTGLASRSIYALFARSGNILAATARGLSQSTNGGATFQLVSNLPAASVTSLATDKDGTILAGSLGSIYILSPNSTSFVPVSPGSGLTTNSIRDVVADSNDELYLATNRGFARSLSGQTQFQMHSTESGLANALLTSVALSNDEKTIFVGTYANGLGRSTDGGQTFQMLGTSQGLSDLRIWRLKATHDGRIFAAALTGVFESIDQGLTFHSVLSGDKVWSITESWDGKIFAISEPGKVYQLDKSSDSFKLLGTRPSSFFSYGVSVSNQADLLVGSNDGLYISSPSNSSFSHIHTSTAAQGEIVYDLVSAGSYVMFISSEGFKYSLDEAKTFQTVYLPSLTYRLFVKFSY